MKARVLVVSAVSVLLHANAFAECAWVLWYDTLTTAANASLSQHRDATPISAFEKKEQCESALDHVAKTSPDAKTREIQTPFGRALQQVRLTCLPDTVDPRGPKGK